MGSGKGFVKSLEAAREGGKQGGILVAGEAFKEAFQGSPKPTPPSISTASAQPAASRMAGDAVSAVTEGREYRNLGKARFRRDP